MIHLKVKTEFNFRNSFGKISDVISHCRGTTAMGIADIGTWGHVQWFNACKKNGIKPLLGTQIFICHQLSKGKDEKYNGNWMTFIAKDNAGLRALYRMNSLANEQMYYVPRLTYKQVGEMAENIIILSGHYPSREALMNMPWIKDIYTELSPADLGWSSRIIKEADFKLVFVCDNVIVRPDQRDAYFVAGGQDRSQPLHLFDEVVAKHLYPWIPEEAFRNTEHIADQCNAQLGKSKLPQFKSKKGIEHLCRDAIDVRLGQAFWDDEYEARLVRELDLIKQKDYEDYFLIVADMINEAKKHMLVGPSRGSSAGSLVCFLLGITEVEPLRYGLIFERFIDINRLDLPDIDIDFPDDKRELVIKYLQDKYGKEKVAHIGTISRYKPRSAIGETAKALAIDFMDTENVKNAIIERSSADARASMCIMDTFTSTEIGQAYIKKYPHMIACVELENHARHSGVHAAGIVISDRAIENFCSVDPKHGIAQLDKYDCEKVNLLKIDVLGLRTLAVLESVLAMINMSKRDLYTLPITDGKVFDVFNAGRLTGIFQFEGYAVQSVTKQMGVHEFNDIVAITSLARPGPLHTGGATKFVERRIGREPVKYIHAAVKPYTEETYGTVVYQEQVMNIVRNVGGLSWEDTSEIRKAMSKSLGDEFFGKYWDKFKAGAAKLDIDERTARSIWEDIMTFGSWAFNKSHAVSYGLVSYWCAWMKAHHPLEFAVCSLNNSRSDDSAVKLLREFVLEGFSYEAFNINLSETHWSIKDGKLIGGLLNIKGVGAKIAADIVERRKRGVPLLKGQLAKLMKPITPFDDIFEARRRFGDYYANPKAHNILTGEVKRL